MIFLRNLFSSTAFQIYIHASHSYFLGWENGVFSEVNGTSIYILYPPVVWIPAQMIEQIYLLWKPSYQDLLHWINCTLILFKNSDRGKIVYCILEFLLVPQAMLIEN